MADEIFVSDQLVGAALYVVERNGSGQRYNPTAGVFQDYTNVRPNFVGHRDTVSVNGDFGPFASQSATVDWEAFETTQAPGSESATLDIAVYAGDVFGATGTGSVAFSPANVRMLAGGKKTTVTAGESIEQGEPVREDQSTGRYMLAFGDNAENADAAAIALTASSNGQPLVICESGDVDYGSGVLTPGNAYGVDGTLEPGTIQALRELGGDGTFLTMLGFAVSDSVLRLGISTAGVANDS